MTDERTPFEQEVYDEAIRQGASPQTAEDAAAYVFDCAPEGASAAEIAAAFRQIAAEEDE